MAVPRPTGEDGNARDRAAVERIAGRPLGDGWAAAALPAGARVRIVKDTAWDGPWRREFLGIIDVLAAPEPVRHDQARPGELMYWVRFDEPEFDHAGDGPYRKAQIWGRYLHLIAEQDGSG